MKKTFALVLALFISLSFISAISIKDVTSSPEEIMPGETATVSIKIENTFGEDITNINMELDLSESPFAPYQSSAEKFIDELESGEDETFDFNIIVLPSTSSGIYKIPVIMTFLDESGNSREEKGLISLVVNSDVELKIFFDDSFLIRGKENTLSIKIINSGLADVKFVYVDAANVIGVKFLSETEQYIGDIDSNDFDSVEYRIYISSNAPNPTKIPVTIRYKDATNKEFVEQKEISLNIYSLKEAQKMGLVKKPNYFLFAGAGVFGLLYILYRFRKKRKLKSRK